MELRNGLATETGWEFYETALDPGQIATTGSSFMIGNGYMGYRGTLAEWDADRLVGCIVADTWDTASEGNVVDVWREHADLMYLPKPDPETKLIEQFDGYFALEDVTPDVVRQRLIDPDEYWGWPNGVAVRTQVLKQADVLQLFALIDEFTPEVMRANYSYYEPRTEHGSSLSPSAHALIASKAELPEDAFRYFEEASSIDLYNQSKKVMSGGSFLGGIHTAACGAVWFMVAQGFAGFEVHGDVLRFRPALPERWEGVRFPLVFRSNHLRVDLRRDGLTIGSAPDNPGAVTVRVGDDERRIEPGQSVVLG